MASGHVKRRTQTGRTHDRTDQLRQYTSKKTLANTEPSTHDPGCVKTPNFSNFRLNAAICYSLSC